MIMSRRLAQLFAGLALYGLSIALLVRADLGLDPWDVLTQGLAEHLPLSFGVLINIIGGVVLLLWWPLRQRPGLGTVANILLIGPFADLGLALVRTPDSLPGKAAMLGAGIIGIGVAAGAYIGAGLGPGPRDGLMTGLVARTGWSIRRVRTGIEVAVLAVGWLLGGAVGLGTVAFALAIGPLVQVFLPLFTIREAAAPA
jgi:uncharacterized membrane protein YczE